MSESRPGDDRPRRRGYARVELERRFLLERLPPGLDPDDYERLRDLYVGDTRLRLRRIERPTGELILVKLGQKQPDPEAPVDPRRRSMTTLYLEPGEERALAALQGARGVKRRHSVREQGRTFVVDVHEEPAAVRGLILAEVECDTLEELMAVEVPDWAVREVTDDPGYSSARLAAGIAERVIGSGGTDRRRSGAMGAVSRNRLVSAVIDRSLVRSRLENGSTEP